MVQICPIRSAQLAIFLTGLIDSVVLALGGANVPVAGLGVGANIPVAGFGRRVAISSRSTRSPLAPLAFFPGLNSCDSIMNTMATNMALCIILDAILVMSAAMSLRFSCAYVGRLSLRAHSRFRP